MLEMIEAALKQTGEARDIKPTYVAMAAADAMEMMHRTEPFTMDELIEMGNNGLHMVYSCPMKCSGADPKCETCGGTGTWIS